MLAAVSEAIPGALTGDAPGAWRHRAACRGTDPRIFFAEDPANVAKAKAVCRDCEVKVECLDWALSQGNLYQGVAGESCWEDRKKLRGNKRHYRAPKS